MPILAVLSLPLARAAGANPADELSGLFLQSCLAYAGQPATLRQWAARAKLPEVPDPARNLFLSGAPGKVFDASIATGKFVLVSADDGICAAITDKAADTAAVRALEAALHGASITFRLVIERDDKADKTLHHREYLATRAGRSWRILLATLNGGTPGRTMLTAAPE